MVSPPRDRRKNMQRALVTPHDGGEGDNSRAGKAVATFMAQTNGRPRPAPRFPLEGGPARKAFVNPTAHWGHNGHSRLGQYLALPMPDTALAVHRMPNAVD